MLPYRNLLLQQMFCWKRDNCTKMLVYKAFYLRKRRKLRVFLLNLLQMQLILLKLLTKCWLSFDGKLFSHVYLSLDSTLFKLFGKTITAKSCNWTEVNLFGKMEISLIITEIAIELKGFQMRQESTFQFLTTKLLWINRFLIECCDQRLL